MTDTATTGAEPVDKIWRARPLILATIGAVAAIVIQQLTDRNPGYPAIGMPVETWRIALAIAIGTGALAFGFGMERVRLLWALAFAVLVGAVAGLVFYWNGEPGWGMLGDWRCASLVLSIAVAMPLFQTVRGEGGWRFPYADVHGHAWTNVVLWFACWLFVGIAFALAWLLAALFDLISLRFLHHLLERHWFMAALAGAGFGAALGLLRERDRVVRLLQRVVTAVLGVLAPVLGAGLLLFLVALPFTGLNALWEATRSTTPILLGCVIGALILANAVIGNGEEDEATNPALRWGAMALGLAALPLAIIAAIATGLRIGQYGLTPDRLWALVFVMIATAYGFAYLVSLVRGRGGWARFVRPANLHLAFVVAGIALFLATPILSFNALSARDQVARLESGRTTTDKFDWHALANEYGKAGRVALARLQISPNLEIRRNALEFANLPVSPRLREAEELAKRKEIVENVRVLPRGTAIPVELPDILVDSRCDQRNPCTLLLIAEGREGLLLQDRCLDKVEGSYWYGGSGDSPNPSACLNAQHFVSNNGKWALQSDFDAIATESERISALAAYKAGKIDVRTVQRRQVFVNGLPVGRAFE